MNAEELLQLAERVEGLSGPDREIDADIWQALPIGMGRTRITKGDERRVAINSRTPHFTASLDAAMTLAPDSWWDHMEVYRPDHQTLGWTVFLMPNGNLLRDSCKGFAATHPLALCAASLRARASLFGKDLHHGG